MHSKGWGFVMYGNSMCGDEGRTEWVTCPKCCGDGWLECEECKEKGIIEYVDIHGWNTIERCSFCEGEGFIRCDNCDGRGAIEVFV